MALRRCLLRRIVPASGVVPATHGAPPPPGIVSRRFMGTGSPKGDTRTIAEIEASINLEKAKFEQACAKFDRTHEEIVKIHKAIDMKREEKERAVDNSGKLTNATIAAIAAVPLLLIFASNYQA